MQTILLTGANGFLGSHLLKSLIIQGYRVVIIKRSTSNTWRIHHLLEKVISYDLDITSIETIFKETKPSIILHTACNYGRSKESVLEVVNSNLILGISLIEQAIKNNVKTFINTDSLLPKNINKYSLSKGQFSEWLKFFSDEIQIINLKIEHMYGKSDDSNKFVSWLINEMINHEAEINLTSGMQKRDFIYVDDIVEAYSLIIKQSYMLSKWNEFDIGTGQFVEMKEFVLTIAKEVEKKEKKDIVSRLKFGIIPYRKGDIMVPKLNNSKITNFIFSKSEINNINLTLKRNSYGTFAV